MEHGLPPEATSAGPEAIVIAVHAPQLFVSSDSVTTPVFPDELLSAQARKYLVIPLSTAGKVYEIEDVPIPPAESFEFAYVGVRSEAPEPEELFAFWKKLVKPVSVLATPVFEIGAENVFAIPENAEVGVTDPAVRSGPHPAVRPPFAPATPFGEPPAPPAPPTAPLPPAPPLPPL